ncbi:MAG: hypothetical protein M1827_003318 [Pycnora praestabilis]|nr:MAG: hypothetical protein M1827_003318 [Pycnora praestabilis]
MPEIGEIARLVHYLNKHLAGKIISSVKVQEDNIVYGKCGITAAQFQEGVAGKKVISAQQQGKYFWLVMSKPPHPVLHCSMTGWIKFLSDDTSYYKPKDKKEDGWPPRFWKFILETEDPDTKAAFVDPRRLGRIRLLHCEGDAIRQTTPLKENGPDPIVDKDILTKEWFIGKVKSKRVPIKAFLLDQANISGVGNWVADEVLYHARMHPEQYTNSLSDEQLEQLYRSLLHICSIAVGTLAESSKFPDEWLMRHRWGKGKKGNKLPDGEPIIFLTVGGRTSAVVPSRQRKTGPVAGDVKADPEGPSNGEEGDERQEPAETNDKKRKSRAKVNSASKKRRTSPASNSKKTVHPKLKTTNEKSVEKVDVKGESDEEPKSLERKPNNRKATSENGPKGKALTLRKAKTSMVKEDRKEAPGRRRSARVNGTE